MGRPNTQRERERERCVFIRRDPPAFDRRYDLRFYRLSYKLYVSALWKIAAGLCETIKQLAVAWFIMETCLCAEERRNLTPCLAFNTLPAKLAAWKWPENRWNVINDVRHHSNLFRPYELLTLAFKGPVQTMCSNILNTLPTGSLLIGFSMILLHQKKA